MLAGGRTSCPDAARPLNDRRLWKSCLATNSTRSSKRRIRSAGSRWPGRCLLTPSLERSGSGCQLCPDRFAAHEPMGIAPRYDLVWLTPPGPGGGGGGGGAGGGQTKVVTPVHQVVRERLTVPTASESKLVETTKEPPPIEPLTIPATPLEIAPPVLNPTPSTETSPHPGFRGGGNGTSSWKRRRTVPGRVRAPAAEPVVVRTGQEAVCRFRSSFATPNQTTPRTRCVRRSRVWWFLECVVLPDGTIGNITIIKSLDKMFGLDQEAVKAARQWRFLPGRRLGQPVPVFVTLELVFTLR